MTNYSVEVKPPARKELEALPDNLPARIARKILRASTMVVAIGVLCNAAPPRVVITGTTLDYFGKAYQTVGVEVFVFPRSPTLTNLIDGVTNATDQNIFDRFGKLIKYVKGTRALARTKSDRDGSFRVEIPDLEKIIVLGDLETEDDPFYWTHSDIDIARRSSVSITLDYCWNR
jgi:hypothetical protein